MLPVSSDVVFDSVLVTAIGAVDSGRPFVEADMTC